MDDQTCIADNLKAWDVWAQYHPTSEFYDVAGFKAGRDTLTLIDDAAFGDVRGRTLLHLQCHFGMDSLSWARRGAAVTGVDFSANAIAAAQQLAAELAPELSTHNTVPPRFIVSDIYKLPELLTEQFDLVYTSQGAIIWLPDLAAWGRVIAQSLKPGGSFFVFDGHPFVLALGEQSSTPQLPRIDYAYLDSGNISETASGSYASPDAPETTSHCYVHPIMDVINALCDAGLIIERLEELPYIAWAHFPWLVADERIPGFWKMPAGLPGGISSIPLSFTLKARKPL